MASYLEFSPADWTDGIPSTLIPASATSTLIGAVRFLPMTEGARVRIKCTGPFQVKAARDGTTAVGGANKDAIQIFVDGKDGRSGNDGYLGAITPTNAVVGWYPSSLAGTISAGDHIVEIQNGQMGISGSSSIGAHVLGVAGTNLSLAPLTAAPARRLVCIDNSELQSCSGNLGINDLLGLLRSFYPGRVSAESMGAATASQWTNLTTFGARLAQHAARATTVDVLYWLGVNDYSGQLASIQTAVTNQLNTVLGIPGINRVVVLTPIPKGTETGARTLGQYRTDIVNAVAAVASPRIVLIDGTAIGLNLGTNYLEAGAGALHPNDSGQLVILGAVLPRLLS